MSVERNGQRKGGSHHEYQDQPLGEFHQRHYGPYYQRNRGASVARPECTGYEGLCVATVMINVSVKLGERNELRVPQIVNPPQLRRASASSSGNMRHLPWGCPILNTPTVCHHLQTRSKDPYQHSRFRREKRGRGPETHVASKEIKYGAPKCPIVHGRPVRLSAQTLGGKVLSCANEFLRVLPPTPNRFVVDVGCTVVEYSDIIASIHQYILGFDVPVDDAHVV